MTMRSAVSLGLHVEPLALLVMFQHAMPWYACALTMHLDPRGCWQLSTQAAEHTVCML